MKFAQNRSYAFFTLLLVACLLLSGLGGGIAQAQAPKAPGSAVYQSLPFSQDWSDTGLITTDNDWSHVPGIVGYRGVDDSRSNSDVDPQTLTSFTSTDVDVKANLTNPNNQSYGGVAEFQISNPVVALQGSVTADNPYLMIYLNTTGSRSIQVDYDLRDVDGSSDNAVQQVALHYRVGESGSFTNVPAAYVHDVTEGNGAVGKVTHVSVTLPSAVNSQPKVQLRVMTSNAMENDEWVGVDNISISGTPLANDLAPEVTGTSPANGATHVAVAADVEVQFSEPVSPAADWYTFECDGSPVPATTAGTAPADTFSLDANGDLPYGAACSVTVLGNKVTDADEDDPPDAMAQDFTFSFTTASQEETCGSAFTSIYTLQGSGETTPLADQSVWTEGVVSGDFQGSTRLNGFFIQDPLGDGDPATSDGVFVYAPNSADVAVGDRVRLQGTVTEYNGQTEMGTLTSLAVCESGPGVAPTTISLPLEEGASLEPYEGMWVKFDQALVVSQNYFLGRYGQVTVSAPERLYTPTNGNFATDSPESNARRSFVLDDGTSAQNPNPIPYLGEEDTLRAGDTLAAGLTGLLDEGGISSTSGAYGYRLQPAGSPPNISRANPRTAAPEAVGGDLRVAGYNLDNYFTTLDAAPYPNGSPYGGSNTPRGADSAAERTRQQAKLVAAIRGIDADVLGLVELEAWSGANAVGILVDAVNAAYGSEVYAAVPEPAGGLGADAIKVALLYKPARVSRVGEALSDAAPIFDRFPWHRPSPASPTARSSAWWSTTSSPRAPAPPTLLTRTPTTARAAGTPSAPNRRRSCWPSSTLYRPLPATRT